MASPRASSATGRAPSTAVAALWLGLLLTAANGQQVTATLSPTTVAQGQPAVYSIVYQGPQTDLDLMPETPVVAGLDFDEPEIEQSFTLRDTVASLQIRIRWSVSGQEPGQYIIPAQGVSFGGRQYATEPVTLEVREGPPVSPSFDPLLRLNVAKTELYVGEVTPITVTALFHRRTQVRNYEHPKLPRENFVVKRFPPGGPAPYAEINGERFQPVEFTSSLSALREGNLVVGPATIENVLVDVPLDADEDGRGPQGLPPSFFQRMRTRQFTLTSEAVPIRVKPLPIEGRPADFTGAVGRFILQSRLAQPAQALHVNDPIAVDLIVTGEGNFDSLSAPLPAITDGWKLYPAKVTQENRGTGLEPGAQVWNHVIVPQQPLTEVPAYVLSFFDPATSTYQTVRSAPIAITVQPEIARPDPRSGEPPAKDFSVVDAALPEEKLDDILTLRPALGAWQPLTPRPRDEIVFWAAQALPAALILAFIGVGLQRRQRERAAAERASREGKPRLLNDIHRDLRQPGLTRREFYSLARELVDAVEFAAGRPAQIAGLNGELDSLLERQALYCYANLPEDATSPIPRPEQQAALATLDKLAR
ncbi:MAG: BatD family protein [Verrucomicrobiales bacterium]